MNPAMVKENMAAYGVEKRTVAEMDVEELREMLREEIRRMKGE